MAHVFGCSSETIRNMMGETQRNALVPGMVRPRQAVVENCSGGRGFLIPDFQGNITKVSCILEKMCKGCPVSAMVPASELFLLHTASYGYFMTWLRGEISLFKI